MTRSIYSRKPRVCSLFVLFVRKKMSSSRNSEEEVSSHSSERLKEVNEHVKEAFAILDRETNRVRKEIDALDEAAKKLEHVHFSKMLKLNVGGHRFETSLATLNKDPGIFELLLQAVAVTRGMLNVKVISLRSYSGRTRPCQTLRHNFLDLNAILMKLWDNF